MFRRACSLNLRTPLSLIEITSSDYGCDGVRDAINYCNARRTPGLGALPGNVVQPVITHPAQIFFSVTDHPALHQLSLPGDFLGPQA